MASCRTLSSWNWFRLRSIHCCLERSKLHVLVGSRRGQRLVSFVGLRWSPVCLDLILRLVFGLGWDGWSSRRHLGARSWLHFDCRAQGLKWLGLVLADPWSSSEPLGCLGDTFAVPVAIVESHHQSFLAPASAALHKSFTAEVVLAHLDFGLAVSSVCSGMESPAITVEAMEPTVPRSLVASMGATGWEHFSAADLLLAASCCSQRTFVACLD